jgi:PilZ domain
MGARRSRPTRVRFDMGYPARIMAIDGTWFRNCHLEDVSQSGAKVAVEGSVEGLNLTEFFLALSRTGNAHRRCRMVWLTGDTMGIRFEQTRPGGDRASRRPEHDEI